MKREDTYQISLIIFSLIAAVIFGIFLYRELFPEYKIYQKDYVALEKFRSTYSGELPPPFQYGVKQIVLPKPDKGPETIDRCISCHVALQFEHFSPTIIATDINGNVFYDTDGFPKKGPNPNYIFTKLEEKIQDLRQEGEDSKADRLAALQNSEKVLQMHPLIGRETRPFEYHPMDEYGCTVCHGGNGRGLVTDRAHGPVFDGTYEETYMGPEPEFLEVDPKNDPLFSKAYNHKPGHRLLFQTSPLLVGNLIQSKCVHCHEPSSKALEGSFTSVDRLSQQREERVSTLKKGFEQEYSALISLLSMRKFLEEKGIKETLNSYRGQAEDITLPEQSLSEIRGNIDYLNRLIVAYNEDKAIEQTVLQAIDDDLIEIVGSKKSLNSIQKAFDENRDITPVEINELLEEGSLKKKADALSTAEEFSGRLDTVQYPLERAKRDASIVEGIRSQIDLLTPSYQQGEQLFISQACYACHKIAGLARGGIGPELTNEGEVYPWFIKESIMWPQADLKTSTMPNFRLDHVEVEDLMTFLLAQRGDRGVQSEVQKKISVAEWEAGKKLPWEKEVSPADVRDTRKSMVIFATEGCAACHRLKGYESNVGYAIEKEKPNFDRLFAERQWFRDLFPEEVPGSEIIAAIEQNSDEINRRIVNGVRKDSLIEEIERDYPEIIPSFYSNFRFASRAKVTSEWEDQVHRVLMMYIQEYGLGRLIGPKPNWSGIYRSNQWLMEHFWKPSSLVARSIMPVFPFDNTKFLALSYMLNALAEKNRDEVREVWQNRGFNPELAFEYFCAQCHGDNLRGNGPVAEWIYPIPKNLSNPVFLRNLTKERAIQSIVHGVAGGPMPPWGEVAPEKNFKNETPVITEEEIVTLVDWLYRNLPGQGFIREVDEVKKWEYQPEDVIRELKEAGEQLQPLSFYFQGEGYTASLDSTPSQLSVEDIFDVVPSPYGREGEKHYYIKRKYYTEKNLEEGKAFFNLNCAICHGSNADGAGLRAGVMEDAKPRVLINLPWLESRDDLRLLRSLVYGVQGTSMIPWGDQTTALQRLQLIMYIRSLTQTKREYEQLTDLLFEVFEPATWVIEKMRESGAKEIQNLEEKTYLTRMERQKKEDVASLEDVGVLYKQELEYERMLKNYREEDMKLLRLQELVLREKELFQTVGNALFSLYGNSPEFAKYLEILALNKGKIKEENENFSLVEPNFDQVDKLKQEILVLIDQTIAELKKEKEVLGGKFGSSEEENDVAQMIEKNTRLKEVVISSFAEMKRIEQKQSEVYASYENRKT